MHNGIDKRPVIRYNKESTLAARSVYARGEGVVRCGEDDVCPWRRRCTPMAEAAHGCGASGGTRRMNEGKTEYVYI